MTTQEQMIGTLRPNRAKDATFKNWSNKVKYMPAKTVLSSIYNTTVKVKRHKCAARAPTVEQMDVLLLEDVVCLCPRYADELQLCGWSHLSHTAAPEANRGMIRSCK